MSRLPLGRTVVVVAVLATLVAPLAAQEVDVTGAWEFVVELDLGSGEPTFVFKQEGETLTGTYEGVFGTAEVTGTVKGNQIEFRFGSDAAEAVYTGTVDGDTMKGTCEYGVAGEGTWEGKRRP